jgi:hypothetical protein
MIHTGAAAASSTPYPALSPVECANSDAPAPTAAPAETGPTAPKFRGAGLATAALPNVGALDVNVGTAGAADEGGETKEAPRLLASSSSACFFARACLSLHVNFFGPPALTLDLRGGAVFCCCCSNAENGFLSFLGAGSETGV